MLSVDEAVHHILEQIPVMPPESKPILEALEQVLAEDAQSDIDIPPLDNSGMDGYALRAADTVGATPQTPKVLRVIGHLPAGELPRLRVEPGTAVKIMTGAPIPPGADAVIPVEFTRGIKPLSIPSCLSTDQKSGFTLQMVESDTLVNIEQEVEIGANIRPAAEDIRRGEIVLQRGCLLGPAEIGVLASLGRAEVTVIRRPKVAILATGDELTEVGKALPLGKIYNSNSYAIAAQVQRAGGIPILLGTARDCAEDIRRKIDLATTADLLITTAGVSVGDRDLVREVLSTQGDLSFWRVRMKPGKPLAFGHIKGVPHLGLPGNPVSAMVAFEQFARPAILKMRGLIRLRKPEVEAILDGSAENPDGRRVFLRAKVTNRDGQYYATLTGPQGSGVLTSMLRANGLVIIPEDISRVRCGDRVHVQMLDWPEE
ncbi:MAG: molybdopterin molybdotransferase MoeA [Chloroflexi bacterium]|nr:molybdopterin molybdotransferase MoeA [Chloroflexota bacterium]MCL5075566.1 molybdopterin molybdotransferase MoeA [Chloroflexota bacterium]